ncbi:uncharacterized protein MELLADRAFT_91367 [Melampsora larici-populina 98AG31]|uniref:DNA-directed RNA polymerase n=1 Tax=Melampsora larici-populina (strain 98AG31 / pathotype 3-4-7) TaxID=747676 RepID=F4RYT2_MELLP|nr:uncharacterized protein MELLADRAFT_91367 [Melampsora larici-populina 98AG31]EGG02301.1 hypothetical protein MELLADRAFT_91367 [Melampsora larici-populina 98AG31]
MKALEDLYTRYDDSVRNLVGGVVQFTYGDDRLDPTYLEGDGEPVEFAQTWRHSKPRFAKACTTQFTDSVLNFITNSVAKQAATYRASYGMYDWDEETDLSAGVTDASEKIVANKTQVTLKQIDTFLDYCWVKYVKAKLEPGTAVGAVGAQSIEEPGTQMTLKTFHFAGVASSRKEKFS